jgi:DNA-binding transcriptional LysR family regulator
MRKAAPGIDVVITQASRETMLAQVADGEADLAVGVFPWQPDNIRTTELFTDRYACVVDAATVRDNGRLDQVAYLARSHVLVVPPGERADAPDSIDTAVARLNGRRKIACTLPHWSVARALIAGTNLVLTSARRTLAALEADPGFAVFDPPFAVPDFTVSMAWHARTDAEPAHHWLRERIVAAAAPDDDAADRPISLRG